MVGQFSLCNHGTLNFFTMCEVYPSPLEWPNTLDVRQEVDSQMSLCESFGCNHMDSMVM